MAEQGRIGTRDAFDAAAADFAALGRHLWEPLSADAVAVADPQPGERVWDACCGTGASAIPTARRVGTDGLVDAVDVSGPMIRGLRDRAADLPPLHAHEADVTTWEGGDYDLVQSVLGIFFLPDMEAGTRHLLRAVRPCGRVALTVWRRGAMDPAGGQLALAVAEVTEAEPPGERPARPIDRINQPDTFAAWLRGLGLSEVDVLVRSRSLSMTPEVAWLLVTGSGYRGALAELTQEQVARVRDRYLARLHEVGLTELDVTTLIGTGRVR
ncbi:methyltransferase domain-containing protein [Saccharopolyspora rhizosphaerae]|uniref:Methyltransferase domain-containing protein n=1 Tax=Saccharopolyspora rhizosphaerae TaxID=2492662 RepID=A0A426JN99_9PSEU|nr:methyltransferase domain-containing protein [Saccharopolyspora rhizosphaerae]RRO14729.1 methyltransferase domain-containing protein [Saccharopolyspora rhizosphaerae]